MKPLLPPRSRFLASWVARTVVWPG
jgi:hypothetical protein